MFFIGMLHWIYLLLRYYLYITVFALFIFGYALFLFLNLLYFFIFGYDLFF